MNINVVYESEIRSVNWLDEDGIYDVTPIGKHLVYMNEDGEYIDLETNVKYASGPSIGDVFVAKKVPITSIIETKKDNMPKRKIIKMYKNTNGGKK